jgi:hypothetical protein
MRIRFGGGRVIEFRPPRVISPFEALRVYSKLEIPFPAHLPFNLSEVAAALVEAALTKAGGVP